MAEQAVPSSVEQLLTPEHREGRLVAVTKLLQ
jgi:hypothetical protein